MKYKALPKYVALGLIPTALIMGAETIRGKLIVEDLFSLFGLWVSFSMVFGFALGFWVLYQLTIISHPGWFRLNVVLAFLMGVGGYLYGANFTDFSFNNFGESLIYTTLFSSIYVITVLVIRWVYLGSKNAGVK